MALSEIIDGIDNALIAHQSVSSIRGLLFVLRDQTEALEEELRISLIRLDNDSLHEENDKLRVHLTEAFNTIERLQAEQQKRTYNRRPEAQNDILRCIACLGPHTTKDLEETLCFDDESLHSHLYELEDSGLLEIDTDFQWSLLRNGRCYLISQHLVE